MQIKKMIYNKKIEKRSGTSFGELLVMGIFWLFLLRERGGPLSRVAHKISDRNKNDKDGSSKTQCEVCNQS